MRKSYSSPFPSEYIFLHCALGWYLTFWLYFPPFAHICIFYLSSNLLYFFCLPFNSNVRVSILSLLFIPLQAPLADGGGGGGKMSFLEEGEIWNAVCTKIWIMTRIWLGPDCILSKYMIIRGIMVFMVFMSAVMVFKSTLLACHTFMTSDSVNTRSLTVNKAPFLA